MSKQKDEKLELLNNLDLHVGSLEILLNDSKNDEGCDKKTFNTLLEFQIKKLKGLIEDLGEIFEAKKRWIPKYEDYQPLRPYFESSLDQKDRLSPPIGAKK